MVVAAAQIQCAAPAVQRTAHPLCALNVAAVVVAVLGGLLMWLQGVLWVCVPGQPWRATAAVMVGWGEAAVCRHWKMCSDSENAQLCIGAD